MCGVDRGFSRQRAVGGSRTHRGTDRVLKDPPRKKAGWWGGCWRSADVLKSRQRDQLASRRRERERSRTTHQQPQQQRTTSLQQTTRQEFTIRPRSPKLASSIWTRIIKNNRRPVQSKLQGIQCQTETKILIIYSQGSVKTE